MRRLILIRHAKSDWADPAQPDHARPLNDRGRRDAPRMARWLLAQGAVPDGVLCSDAARTRATLALMLREWPTAPAVTTTPALYHAGPDAILAEIQRATVPVLAIVAHNPGIAAFAAGIVHGHPTHPRWRDFPTCATAVIDIPQINWADLRPGMGRVLAFAVPGDL